MKLVIGLLAALCLGTAALAHDFVAGDLKIHHPAIPAPIGQAQTAAGYMTITNTGTEADRLTGVTVGFAAEAMVHETTFDANGVATMTHLMGLDIPAGATVTLEPGGRHVMFMGLTAPLTEGEALPGTLIFDRAGPVEVTFKIEPRGAATTTEDHDHAAPAANP